VAGALALATALQGRVAATADALTALAAKYTPPVE
jgi:hypothetical protein